MTKSASQWIVDEISSFTCRIFEHKQIEASDRRPLLDAYLKKFFDIKINGNNSSDNYNGNNNKKLLLVCTKIVDSVEIPLWLAT